MAKIVAFTNTFGEDVFLPLCAKHVEEFTDPEVRAMLQARAYQALDALRASGMSAPPAKMIHHPAQEALLEHQESCEACGGVRDWIAEEQKHGRLRSEADVNRVGLYVMEHACEAGIELNYQVGLAMREEHEPELIVKWRRDAPIHCGGCHNAFVPEDGPVLGVSEQHAPEVWPVVRCPHCHLTVAASSSGHVKEMEVR